ncbi:hypothetical protein CS542_06000 [Pedobacter sp. IW39]|nr:hypothetical protein CS542_06000 [Pedobacter sp. IW39]
MRYAFSFPAFKGEKLTYRIAWFQDLNCRTRLALSARIGLRIESSLKVLFDNDNNSLFALCAMLNELCHLSDLSE